MLDLHYHSTAAQTNLISFIFVLNFFNCLHILVNYNHLRNRMHAIMQLHGLSLHYITMITSHLSFINIPLFVFAHVHVCWKNRHTLRTHQNHKHGCLCSIGQNGKTSQFLSFFCIVLSHKNSMHERWHLIVELNCLVFAVLEPWTSLLTPNLHVILFADDVETSFIYLSHK